MLAAESRRSGFQTLSAWRPPMLYVLIAMAFLLSLLASSSPGQDRGKQRFVSASSQERLAFLRPEAPQRKEHPIMPALRWAYSGVKHIEGIRDYSCTLIKRERQNGQLGQYQYLRLKVRHRPFSVYIQFLSPASVRGREAIYVEGRNNGKLLVHGTGVQALFGTRAIDPHGALAMKNCRHPVTKVGILNLTRELIRVGEHERQFGECELKFLRGAQVNDRVCTCMQVRHPHPRREFRYHMARLYVDDELNVPIRFEAYTWPQRQGGQPVLTEEYTYSELKLNNGFGDADFDVRNTRYNFPR